MSQASEDVVELLASFKETALWNLCLLLLLSLFGRPEDLICKTLQSVVVLSLVLSMRMEDADPI
jgi:hypothetical protein